MDGIGLRACDVCVRRVPHRAVYNDVAKHAQAHLPRRRHWQNHHVYKISTKQHYILCIWSRLQYSEHFEKERLVKTFWTEKIYVGTEVLSAPLSLARYKAWYSIILNYVCNYLRSRNIHSNNSTTIYYNRNSTINGKIIILKVICP